MKNQVKDIEKIKELIQNDELEKALNELDNLLKDNNSIKEILFQKGRFSNLLTRDRLGIISFDDANLERNKIRKSIIDLISEWEKGQLPKSNLERVNEFFIRNRNLLFKLFLAIAVSLIVGFFITKNNEKKIIDVAKYIELGNDKFEKEKWQDALFYFDALVKLEPQNISFLERKGYCNFGLKRYDQALADFNKAIENGPVEKNPQLLFFRGNTKRQLGDHESAINDFNQLLKIQPRHLGATNQRGLSYIEIGKNAEACLDFNRVYKFGIKSLKDKAKINIDRYCN